MRSGRPWHIAPSGPWLRLALAGALLAGLCVAAPEGVAAAERANQGSVRVTLDFNEVDLPVFVRFISELTGKNFVLDESTIKGKVTVYSPTKVTVEQAYGMFLAALEVRKLRAIPRGRVIQIVEDEQVEPQQSVYLYKLRNANAAQAATVLTSLVAKSAPTQRSARRERPMRPGAAFDAAVEVFADAPTNSLLITATPESYKKLLPIIEGLDVRRKQVFVEAVILEVAMDRLRQLGTDPVQAIAAGASGSIRGIIGINRLPEDIAAFASALSGSTNGSDLTVLDSANARAFLQLVMNLRDTNILSTPQVLASNNETAKIVVGENRPFVTGQAQGITGGTITTIERRDLGVTLEMTPQVLEENLIRIKMKQEITSVTESVAQTIGTGDSAVPVGPTYTKRAMETIAVAKHQQTIVVGGLVRDNTELTESKVPLLGDIPLLGWLFRSESKRSEKVNLLVFLTPHVIEDDYDVVDLNQRQGMANEELRRQMNTHDAVGVQREMQERLLNQTYPDKMSGDGAKPGANEHKE